jgi:hypothetical protein
MHPFAAVHLAALTAVPAAASASDMAITIVCTLISILLLAVIAGYLIAWLARPVRRRR